MSRPALAQLASVAAIQVLLAACSSAVSPASAPVAPLSPMGIVRRSSPSNYFSSYIGQHSPTGRTSIGFYACPANGPLVYLVDGAHYAIDVFRGDLDGQGPCGQLTGGLIQPQSLYVDLRTHDLYVADTGAHDSVVFHRGQIVPFNTYTDPDPNGQYPGSIVVASDGTVIVSNYYAVNGPEMGSFSTWIEGPNGGTFVGNFPFNDYGQGRYMAINKESTVYYSDFEAPPSIGGYLLWFVSCPRGHCGRQRQVAGVTFTDPFGMVFSADGDLIVEDTQPGRIETFELPNPQPATLRAAGYPDGLAIDLSDQHLFIADGYNLAEEYAYPGWVPIGVVLGDIPRGIAFDP